MAAKARNNANRTRIMMDEMLRGLPCGRLAFCNNVLPMPELKTRILIVDDDQRHRDLLVKYLGNEGYDVKAVADAPAMDKQLARDRYDLLVLDLMLPGEDGLSICRRLRAQHERAGHHHAHRQGRRRRPHRRPGNGRRRLPAQAVQPARAAGAHRRRAAAARPRRPARRAGRGRHLPVRRVLAQPGHPHASTRAGKPVALTTGEFSVLKVLVQHPRQPLSRDKLMELARGREYEVFDRSIDVQISRLRKIVEDDPSHPKHIQTVWGFGYVFVPGRGPEVSLFARSFLLIAALIVTAVLASFQIYRIYELEPRSRELAQQTVSTVNLTRAALVSADPFLRRDLLVELNETEGLRVFPATASEKLEALPEDELLERVEKRVRDALGADTRFAFARDGEEGFLVSFFIDEDEFWVMLPRERFDPEFGLQWLGWGAALLALALVGAWLIASNLARSLAALGRAAGRLGRGEAHQPLAESGPRELRSVAAAFNRMASDLDSIERERAMVLAGISHDLRTPLSRMRLGLEMSGAEADAARAIATDIDEIDAIIGQFLDFARGANEQKTRQDPRAVARRARRALLAPGQEHLREERRRRAVLLRAHGGAPRARQPDRQRAALCRRAGRSRAAQYARRGADRGARPRAGHPARRDRAAEAPVHPARCRAQRPGRLGPGPGDRRAGGTRARRPARPRAARRRRAGGPPRHGCKVNRSSGS